MEDLIKTLRISGSGLRAQGTRLRVIAENIANASSLPQEPGDQPYRRKLVTFRNQLDRNLGLEVVRADRIRNDLSDFGRAFDPGHPAADDEGYVQTPNVNFFMETLDMREAQRSYEANLGVIRSTRDMLNELIRVLRPQ